MLKFYRLNINIKCMTNFHLCDVGEADDEGDEADNEYEDLLPLPQHHGIFIHQSCDEAFHCAELTQGREAVSI